MSFRKDEVKMPDTNEVFDKLKSDFQQAIDREIQIRVTYETSLIPTLERDLQAARRDVESLIIERDSLLKWKSQSETALALADRALTLLGEAMSVAPGSAPVEG